MILNTNKMKRIAIIEIYSHHVFVKTLSSVLERSGCQIDIYLSNKIYKEGEPLFQNNSKNVTFHISNTNESDFMFLRRIKPKIELENELVILNSVQGYRILFFFLFKFKIPTIAGAGRISEFFGSRYKVFGLKGIRRILHHNFTVFLLPKIIKRLKGIIVHTQQANDLALDNNYQEHIHKMPFSLYEGRSYIKKDNNINFLVTGSISDTSRDFDSLLNIFENIWQKGLLKNKLVVLSNPKGDYGNKILTKMENLSNLGYPIKYFSGWIPEEEYTLNSETADFIIAPVLEAYYGKGELTSVTVESIKKGIPAIYPIWYKPEPQLESCSIYYNSFDDIINIIENLSNNPKSVEQYQKLAQENLSYYSLENESKKMNNFLNNLNH